MGKGKSPFKSFFSYGLGVMTLLSITGCDVGDPALLLQSGRTFGMVGLEGRWVGEVLPTVANCGTRTKGLMNIGHGEFAFDPFQSTLVVRGNVIDDRLAGKLEKLGGEKRIIVMVADAQAIPTPERTWLIRGQVKSGACQWQFELHQG